MVNRSLKKQISHSELNPNKEITHNIKHSFARTLNKDLAQEEKIATLHMERAN